MRTTLDIPEETCRQLKAQPLSTVSNSRNWSPSWFIVGGLRVSPRPTRCDREAHRHEPLLCGRIGAKFRLLPRHDQQLSALVYASQSTVPPAPSNTKTGSPTEPAYFSPS